MSLMRERRVIDGGGELDGLATAEKRDLGLARENLKVEESAVKDISEAR